MTLDPISAYHARQTAADQAICDHLRSRIDAALPDADSKLWHAHPVWFLADNPVVGYSRQKAGLRLMFWSGADFDESGLRPGTGKFKDASALFTAADQIDDTELRRWLDKARSIQWDYRNLMRNKRLIRIG